MFRSAPMVLLALTLSAGGGMAQASTPAAPVTLDLRWSAPEPVLVGGEVQRPVLHRSLRVTLGAGAQARREALARAYREIEARTPRDLRFTRTEAGWVGRAVTGWQVDRDLSGARVERALREGQRRVTLAVRLVAPARSVRWAQQRGLRHLASGHSDFAGSPDFRVHNIRVGAERLHGTWLAAGEAFSFNARVGRVDARSGFQRGYVVTGNTLSLEDGGGLCQVSTTAFRAALWAGLPITERHAHSVQVGYYGAPGLDAAVYAPAKDLRFVNNTPGPLLMQASWDLRRERLSLHLFGTHDGRRVVVERARLEQRVASPGPTYLTDPTLAPGEVRRIDMPASGLKATATRVVRGPGGEVRRDELVSRYRPWGGVFAVAPGDARAR